MADEFEFSGSFPQGDRDSADPSSDPSREDLHTEFSGDFGADASRSVSPEAAPQRDDEILPQFRGSSAGTRDIIGQDNRQRVADASMYPFSCICALRMKAANGDTLIGTAWLINSKTLVTAGHNVFDHRRGGPMRGIEVHPGCNGNFQAQARATSYRSTVGWLKYRQPEADYAVILLDRSLNNLGTFGYSVLNDSELRQRKCNVVGFPHDKQFQMWGHADALTEIRASTLRYNIDTLGGNSGGPVFIMRDDRPVAVGIHNYGSPFGNTCTRITKEVYENIMRWKA